MFDLLGQVDKLAPGTCIPMNTSNLVMDAFFNILYIISQICPAIKMHLSFGI